MSQDHEAHNPTVHHFIILLQLSANHVLRRRLQPPLISAKGPRCIDGGRADPRARTLSPPRGGGRPHIWGQIRARQPDKASELRRLVWRIKWLEGYLTDDRRGYSFILNGSDPSVNVPTHTIHMYRNKTKQETSSADLHRIDRL